MKKVFFSASGFFRSGWSLLAMAAAILVVAVAFLLLFGVISGITGITVSNNLGTFLNFLMDMLMGAAIILLFRLLYKLPLAKMGFATERWLPRFLHGVAIGFVSISVVVLAFGLFGETSFTFVGFTRANALPILFDFLLMLAVGFFEEAFSRGYMMTALRTTGLKPLIFLFPAVLFSLAHFINPGFDVLAGINILLIGIVFGYMFIRTGSLWMPIGYHFMWNFAQGSVWGQAVSGGAEYNSVIRVSSQAPAILIGGEFAPESGLVVTVMCVLIFLYVHFVVKKPQNPLWTMEKLVKAESTTETI
jgi:membrane protease YdiL (CAAX protease family)